MARSAKKAPPLLVPPIRQNKSGSWGYASGRVWCLEKDLLGQTGQDQLFAAECADDIRRLLLEHKYPQQETLEDMVQAEACRLYGLLDEVAPDDGYHQVLVLGADAHNLKLALKAALLDQPAEAESYRDRLLRPSLIEGDLVWKALVLGEKDALLPDWAAEIADRARADYQIHYSAEAMDRIVDRGISAIIRAITARLSDPWLTGYFDRVSDLTNLETLLRVRHRGLTRDYLEASLLPGGLISSSSWLLWLDLDQTDLMDALCPTPYNCLSGYAALYGEKDAAPLFARDRDNLLCDYLAGGFSTLSGAPRVLAYVMARTCEFKNIRIALAGLSGGSDPKSAAALRRGTVKA